MTLLRFLDIHRTPVVGVILAGGKASRLGGVDKGGIDVGGRTIFTRITEALAPQVGALSVSARGAGRPFNPHGLPVLSDEIGAVGPLAGILAGLEWAAAGGYSWLLTAPTDTPFLPPDLVIRLAHGLERGAVAIAASRGRSHPVIGLWPVQMATPLRQFLVTEGRRKVQDWAECCGAVVVEWPDLAVDPFFNVNTPEDRQQAQELCCLPALRTAAVVLPGKETGRDLLEEFVPWASGQGLRLGGLIQRGHDEAVLVDLEAGAILPIMQKLGREAGCAVDTQAIASAGMVVRGAVERRCDLVIVNKFGPLEADGCGLADEMMAAMANDLALLTTVSTDRLNAWLSFCGGLCQLLPPDQAALRRWASTMAQK